MTTGGLGHLLATGHSRHFLHASRALDPFYLGTRSTAAADLLHAKVRIGQSRDLRQVGDAQHLVARGQLRQNTTHPLGQASAYPSVDFIKDQKHAVRVAPQHVL